MAVGTLPLRGTAPEQLGTVNSAQIGMVDLAAG